MRAGRLRHRVTIQKKGPVTRTASGQESFSWIDVATVWASIEPQSGREAAQAERVTAAVNTLIMTRYRAGVTAAMRVVKGAQIWNIQTVLDPEQRHRELQLVCVEQPATAGS